MAWTPDRWPLAAGASTPNNLLSCANELRTELNARHGTALVAAFAAGQSTWDAIKIIRDAVDSVVDQFYDGDDSLKRFAATGVAGSGVGLAATRSIFEAAFGGARVTWLNAPATESTAPAYDPTEGDPCYKTYLNELYSVIDLLQWLAVDTTTYSSGSPAYGVLRRRGAAYGEADEQAALDAAYTAYLADTPTPLTHPQTPRFYLSYYDTYPGAADAYFLAAFRVFRQATIPTGSLSCKAVMVGPQSNSYLTGAGYVATPQWYAEVYLSTTTPGAIADADWTYGALAATLTVPNVHVAFGDPLNTDLYAAALTGFTAGSLHYFQLLVKDDDVEPQWIVDDGDWDEGQMYRELEGNLRILYSFI